METKRQFVSYYADRASRGFIPTSRERVAYLLRAARSRGDGIIHRIRQVYGCNYRIGMLMLNVRHAYHDQFIKA